ncbi:MAG: glycoside hydrolase family 57 protein [Cytophagales bacterium]|nr:glycoside hydrolase family 57 protein [Cytophagales bacterium]
MKKFCLYFQVHQPFRLRGYHFFNIARHHDYFDDPLNKRLLKKVAENCYLPANKLFLNLFKRYHGRFKIALSISGTALDQFELYAPEVIGSFQELVSTGSVELLAETDMHSLASLVSPQTFKAQVNQHMEKIGYYFHQSPAVFRNTELIYANHIGKMLAGMGFRGTVAEGVSQLLENRSPNHVYTSADRKPFKLLLRNFPLSDDISFRFSDRAWDHWPLTVDKFLNRIDNMDPSHEIINLFMDYETLGEHQKKESGIFDFIRNLPEHVFKSGVHEFCTPAKAMEEIAPAGQIDVPEPASWADSEKDLSAWLGNDMQKEAFENLYALEASITQIDDASIINDWRYLQTSDHFYYMSTKLHSDGEVHNYFNPYRSPYEAFINYMNVVNDLTIRISKKITKKEAIHQSDHH